MTNDTWYLITDGATEAVGPFSTDLISRGIAGGKIPSTSKVCKVGTEDWVQIDSVAPFGDALLSPLSLERRPPATSGPPVPQLPQHAAGGAVAGRRLTAWTVAACLAVGLVLFIVVARMAVNRPPVKEGDKFCTLGGTGSTKYFVVKTVKYPWVEASPNAECENSAATMTFWLNLESVGGFSPACVCKEKKW